MNNVVRTTLQALAAVPGGTNSLHTNSLDEALALPTSEAATLALRTQQILAHETGITSAIDPLGGSYFVERLTCDLEEEVDRDLRIIDAMGGMVAAIERGYPQREIAESAYRFQQDVDQKRRIAVGVNELASEAEQSVPILQIDETVAESGNSLRSSGSPGQRRHGSGARTRQGSDGSSGKGEHDAGVAGCRPCVCDDWGDVRCTQRCFVTGPGASHNLAGSQ